MEEASMVVRAMYPHLQVIQGEGCQGLELEYQTLGSNNLRRVCWDVFRELASMASLCAER